MPDASPALHRLHDAADRLYNRLPVGDTRLGQVTSLKLHASRKYGGTADDDIIDELKVCSGEIDALPTVGSFNGVMLRSTMALAAVESPAL